MKQVWCDKYFGEEQPDCLPVPDRHEKYDSYQATVSIPVDKGFTSAEFAAGTLLLLGLYGGIEESGLLVWKDGGFFPLRLHWDKNMAPAELLKNAEEMLHTGASFDWTYEEAADLLGQETGRRMALSFDGNLPEEKGLALSFQSDPGVLKISYAVSCYTESFVHTMGLSWKEILQSLSGTEKLSEIRVVSEDTLTLLDSFNQTQHPYDQNATIIDQFRTRASEMPDNIAVIYEERSYTYAEVDDLSDRLAYYLSCQGLGCGDTVAVFIPRSEYMVIASLGVLKAGCAYIPLDPNYPDERLDFMTKDGGAGFLLVDDSLVSRLENFKSFSGKHLCISGIASLPAVSAAEISRVTPPKPEDLFLLIYTSGTTGVPKGVRLMHRNLMAYAAWHRRFFQPDASTRVTCYNSYGFDGSLADMYPILTVGGATVVIPEEKKLDLPAIADIIRRHHIVHADLPSQVGRQFALTMDCPELKYIVVGGEKLVSFDPVYPYILVNEYGPTEATICITAYSVTKYEPDIPIGKALDNTAIYIVDSAGRRVPPGALGELWVAGVQVTDGYLNRPEKTKETFVPNPFSQEKGYETAYRTGDIVRYLSDGNIEFAGRRDGLVKIRGFRVELAEVEGVIRDFPPVKNAAVIACNNPAGGQFIAAYVTGDAPIDKKALADFIRERKPPYMVPAAILQIDEIPHNQNGKLNKKALPVPEIGASETPYIAPKNETEAALARGFGVALGREQVSAEEDFFAAGGDSLSIVRLLSECRSLKLNFNLIFEGKTPAGIAALLARREKKGVRKKRETHFLGPLQELHYDWGNSLEEGYGLHCDATIYLSPETDMERLAAAIERTLQAHPAVDARLTPAADGKLRWKPGDLKDLRPTVEVISRESFDILKKTIRQPMNRPEMRMFVIRLFVVEEDGKEPEKQLYFDFLHPIIDGDSVEIFLQDVDAAYRGEKPEAEEYSIFDFYDEIEDNIGTSEYQEELEWNRDYVRSFTEHPSVLKGDLEDHGKNETRDIMVPLHVNLAEIDAFTGAQDVTDGSILAAAFGLLQGRCNGEDAAVALTIYNGRDDIRYERTMGVIYRHYPLCVRWTPEMTARDFVRKTQESVMLCRRHALYEGDPVPLLAAFAYQGEDPDDGFEFCGGPSRFEEIEDFEEEHFDFFIHRRKDDFYCNLTYNTKEYSDEFISCFLENYTAVLHGLAQNKTIADILKQLK